MDSKKIGEIARGGDLQKHQEDIRQEDIRSSGYVLESLEAAMWCFVHSGSFKEAVLMAANLGDDADTSAAVCGQAAGAYYALRGIFCVWLERLPLHSNITELTDRLYRASRKRVG